MRILVIGDVTSPTAAEKLAKRLWDYRKNNSIDAVIVNAENAGFITGAHPEIMETLLRGGADCLTGGNHTMRNRRSHTFLEETKEVVRPINFGASAPGRGYTVIDVCGYRMLVINAMGQVNIDPVLNSPFAYIDRALSETEGKYDISLLDIHAEATGEKYAIANYFDGRISAVYGTHTHVQTADEQILPKGTGYISDIGMCGESGGILGIETSSVVDSVRMHLPPKFTPATGEVVVCGAIFTIDTATGKTTGVERVKFNTV